MPIMNTVIQGGGTTPTGTKSITANGVYDVTNYAVADVQVPSTAPDRYLAYDVSSSGEIQHDKTTAFMSFNNVKKIPKFMFYEAYKENSVVTSADMSNVEYVDESGCKYMFQSCSNLTALNFSSLWFVGQGGFGFLAADSNVSSVNFDNLSFLNGSYTFQKGLSNTNLSGICSFPKLFYLGQGGFNSTLENTNITKLSLPHLTHIGSSGLDSVCSGCSNLTIVELPSLNVIESSGTLMSAFKNTNITEISFPSLSIISGTGINHFSNMLSGITGCVLHFPSNLQTKIESMNQYPNFGGTNTTVLFDLPARDGILDYKNLEEVYQDISNMFVFANQAANKPLIKKINMPNVKIYNGQSFNYFSSLSNLTEVDLSKLEQTNFGSSINFSNAPLLIKVNLDSLVRVKQTNTLFASAAFGNDNYLTSLSFYSLKDISGLGQKCFQNSYITNLYFYAISVSSNLNYGCFYEMGANSKVAATIHFPNNMTNKISALQGYDNVFSFPSGSSIVFDLPATMDLTGANSVVYERNPKDDTQTALAWRINQYDSDGYVVDWTPYYTSGTADPQVNDTIYSDSACTTAVTTISSIA